MQEIAYNQQNYFRMQSTLAEYPILRDRIIEAMLNQLVRDQVFSLSEIQVLVTEKAIRSQTREGLNNPFIQEGPAGWEHRLSRIRAHLIIDQYANQYTFNKFIETVNNIVENRPVEKEPDFFWHNVEFASTESIFEQALQLERDSAAGNADTLAALSGAKTVLIRRCLSEDPDFIEVAKKHLKVQDIYEVNQKKIGQGPIGGKAAGFVLARTILQNSADEEIRSTATTRDSYFIGADEFQTFLATNNLLDIYDTCFLPDQERWDRYPFLHQRFQEGALPGNLTNPLRRIIGEIDGRPFIVRSSSLLEDSYRSTVNSIYESVVVPNQGTQEEGLVQLQDAIREMYAQVFNPQAIQYREKKKLVNTPERMGIIIQIIRGHCVGNYFFPDLSGFSVSQSSTRWSPFGKPHELESGYTRFVLGLGSHALYRHSSDFPMFVRLAEPIIPETWKGRIFNHFSQKLVAVINLKSNRAELIDIADIPTEKYPFSLFAAQNQVGGKLQSVQRSSELDRAVLTFHDLIYKTNFVKILRSMMTSLDEGFERPVAIEYSVICDFDKSSIPTFRIQIDKCRPIVKPAALSNAPCQPTGEIRKFIETEFNVIDKLEKQIHYVVVVEPRGNYNRDGLQYWIRTLNRELADASFVFFSRRRFGVADNGPGIRVKFADVQNAAALIELSDPKTGEVNDFPGGTQFYSNMIEIGIAYIPVFLGSRNTLIDWSFFETQPNVVRQFIDLPNEYRGMIRVLPAKGYQGYGSLTLRSSLQDGKTTLYLTR